MVRGAESYFSAMLFRRRGFVLRPLPHTNGHTITVF